MGFPRSRRQTLLLMQFSRRQAPITLTAEVDMRAVVAHRTGTGGDRHPAFVSYVTYAAARALRRHPEANAAFVGRLWPRRRLYPAVMAKVAVDMNGAAGSFVAGVVVPAADLASLADIDLSIRRHAGLDPDRAREFSTLRTLWRAPWPLAAIAFGWTMASTARRQAALGSFSVSGLGNRPVTSVAPVGGTTVSVGVGQVHDVVVARDAQILIQPGMTLTLVFDHRIIDGALAADLLSDTVRQLERWTGDEAGCPRSAPPAPAGAVRPPGELADRRTGP